MKEKRAFWTDDEMQYLKDNVNKFSYNEIAQQIKKSPSSVKNKIFSLKLIKNNSWSQNKINLLKSLRQDGISYEEIAELFNVSKRLIVNLSAKHKISCPKHLLSQTRIHKIWSGIIERCFMTYHKSYKHYGGRGISMCKEWEQNFVSFYTWAINNGYEEHLTIDRIDVNGNYCPENCRWATTKEQANNKRNNVILTAFGETKSLTMWSEDDRCSVSKTTIMNRIRNKWTTEDAISKKNTQTNMKK
mgnify:CR=1 FL=1